MMTMVLVHRLRWIALISLYSMLLLLGSRSLGLIGFSTLGRSMHHAKKLLSDV